MSNPFLDPILPQEDSQGEQGMTGLGATNPFTLDLMVGGNERSQSGMNQSVTDTLLDLTDDSQQQGVGAGVLADDILLEIGDEGQSSFTLASGGGVDLMDASFGEEDISVPPPMEFSDILSEPHPSVNQEISHDLLIADISTTVNSGPSQADKSSVNGSLPGSNGSEDGFDFLSDVDEARQQAAGLLVDIAEEDQEPPQLPSQGPPPVPSSAPPPVPQNDDFGVEGLGVDVEIVGTDQDPMLSGNQDMRMLDSEASKQHHIFTSDIVDEQLAHSDIDAARAEIPPSQDLNLQGKLYMSTADETQIQVNNKQALQASLPTNVFRPTSMGVTKTPKYSSVNNGQLEDEEEEEITPMAVHRDHHGNKLAAPSSRESWGKLSAPRKLDETAKQHLQTAMSMMTSTHRPLVSHSSPEEDVDVMEEEIVPVKLTRKQAETALEVVSKWMSGQSTNTQPPPVKKSGFQGVVGTVMGVQAGRVDLPSNSISFTTVGVTRTPKVGQDAQEEEEITPMTVHKDHLGKKHYAPSAPEQLGKTTTLRKLDAVAKQDIASLMSSMPAKVKTKQTPEEEGADAMEDEIVPVKLTRKEAETALDVVSRWMSDQSTMSQSPPIKKSGFQGVVGTVMGVQAGRVDLPSNSISFTTVGVTRTPKVGQDAQEEEEITPMTVHKDHLGKKHYAPSAPEQLGTRTSLRKLDAGAKQDIASLMSSMPAKVKTKQIPREDEDIGVPEETIVATVLSKREADIAMEAVAKWVSEEPKTTQTKASPFQRLVDSVVQSVVHTQDGEEEPAKDNIKEHISVVDNYLQQTEEVIKSSRVSTASSAPPTETKPAQQSEKPTPPPVLPKPAPPQVAPKPTLAQRKSLFDEPDHAKPDQAQEQNALASSTESQSSGDAKPEPRPVPTQRGVRGSGKLPSLGQTTSLSTSKTLSKIGMLSTTPRTTPSLFGSKTTATSALSKTRCDDSPFLVEVLKGIVGLGIKVKVTDGGQVEVTEVQKNSPVDKNGNVRVGDNLLSVNGTELQGLSEGRVQQVLRLLPRVVVKLVFCTRPSSTSDPAQGSSDSDKTTGGQTSPRSLGSYSQYGVRLAPQPYSPTSSDGRPPSFTTSSPDSQAVSAEDNKEDNEEEEEDDDMASRKLTKALSPRSAQTFSPEPPSPPKPSPRQRHVPTSLSPTSTSPPKLDDSAEDLTPHKTVHKMTASEIVAAASRRPSGRDEDLPQPPPVSPPPGEDLIKDEHVSSKRHPSDADTAQASSRHPSGVGSTREDVPVFESVAKKLSPVPTPRPKVRSSSDENPDPVSVNQTPRENDIERNSCLVSEGKVVMEEGVQAQSASVSHSAAPQVAPKKVPPPVAPKPKRTLSVSSDKSYSSGHSDDTPKDLSSPTSGSARVKDFTDSTVSKPSDSSASKPTDQNRKSVTSAARMFERKATEVKPVSPLTQPTKSSRPVSSVIKSFNRESDSETSSSSGVTMRRVSVGRSVADSSKTFNSALLPSGDRRKSMPVSMSGSLSLTKPSSLSHLRYQPAGKKTEEGDTEKSSPRFNSALRPRSAMSTSSLRSVITTRDNKGDKQTASDTVNKDSESYDVTYRPRSTASDSRSVLSDKHKSWSPQTEESRTPRMIYNKSSMQHDHGSKSSAWEKSGHLESTMKKFDDLLSDKHTLDSDEELPKVSNSVSLDLLKSSSAGETDVTVTSSQEHSSDSSVQGVSLLVKPSETDKLLETKELTIGKVDESSKTTESEAVITAAVDKTETTYVFDEKLATVEEDVQEVTQQVFESSPVTHVLKEESIEQTEKTDRQPELSACDIQLDIQTETVPEPHVPNENSQTQVTGEHVSQIPVQMLDVIEEMTDTEPQVVSVPSINISAPDECMSDEYQAAPADVSITEDDYPPQDTMLPMDAVQETVYHQQASTIVQSVLSNALKDVTSRPQTQEPEEEDPPPPLPDMEPPPLPGAPPPPLIFRNTMERLVDAEDLEGMVLSQDSTSLKTSPLSRAELDTSSTEASSRYQPTTDVVEADSVELEIEESISVDTPNFSLPLLQGTVQAPESQAHHDKQPAADSDVLISFHSPSQSLTVDPDFLGDVGLQGKKFEGEVQEEHPPVSDTLSQDSGVQDEDMSEDGLRFSHDDSPTSQGDSSLFDTAMTPDEVPASTLKDTMVGEEDVVTPVKPPPVPSPRSKLQQPSLPVSAPQTVSDSDNETKEESIPQEVTKSHSVKPVQTPVVQSTETTETTNIVNNDTTNRDSINSNITKEQPTTDVPQLPTTAPPQPDTAGNMDNAVSPQDQSDTDCADLVSERKWCILDQSGSLFLHGASSSPVKMERDALRQVSSMSPGELVAMVTAANRDLDSAKLPLSVELRLVAARALNGRTLSVDVTQRQDYLVQVTRVHSKDSPLEEADLLLALDGRTLKNRRPAQVLSQLETSGPKGILLTARGVKLPPSLVRSQEGASDSSSDSPRSPRGAPSPTPTTPTTPTPAVQVSPGVYDVIMVKGATGVGFCLEGGKASPKGDLPILIKRIFRGGPAEKCGQLKVKDEILAVNGIDFTVMRHYEAWNHLKFLDDGEIRLRIRREE